MRFDKKITRLRKCLTCGFKMDISQMRPCVKMSKKFCSIHCRNVMLWRKTCNKYRKIKTDTIRFCKNCNLKFKARIYEPRINFCSKKCKNQYFNQLPETKQAQKQWFIEHPNYMKIYMKKRLLVY